MLERKNDLLGFINRYMDLTTTYILNYHEKMQCNLYEDRAAMDNSKNSKE